MKNYFIVLMLVFLTLVCGVSRSAVVDDNFKIRAVNSIIGESEGEGLEGMRMIASCLRNRAKTMHDPFKGVYGEKSARVLKHLYGAKAFVLAVRAYEDSAKHDYSNGAQGWGNDQDLKSFAKHKWWKRCVIVGKYKNHTFYRELKAGEVIFR